MTKRIFLIGFTLFAMFFGAGNLIFPPTVGQLSGSNFNFAILGFVITGVGLPLLGIIGGSFTDGGYSAEAKRVHPLFSLLFIVTICLTIGPFFAIPRTATVSFELDVLPYLINYSETDRLPIIIFSGIYFLIVLFLSLNPSKIVDRVGQVLTPFLLITIILLIFRAFYLLNTPITDIAEISYVKTPFFKGFFEGYQTMDTIATIPFAIVILQSIKLSGITNQKDVFRYASLAAIIAGVGLGLVYISLGWIGNNYTLSGEVSGNLGTAILTEVARLTYGEIGRILLSTIVTLACLTTAIGLIVAISSYFNQIIPIISYKMFAILFTFISFIIAGQGLNSIISGAIPVLIVVYPITIVMISLIFIDKALKTMPNLAMQLPILGTVIISIASVIQSQIDRESSLSQTINSILTILPFHESQMEWMIPAIALFLLGLLLGYGLNTKRGIEY